MPHPRTFSLAACLLLITASPAVAGELSGRVLDASGAPLPGATIYAYDLRLAYTRATVGADGAYTVTGLAEGPVRLRAVPAQSQNAVSRTWPDAWSFCEAELIHVPAGGVLEGYDFALAEGSAVRGTVVDAEGAPIGGAIVTARGASAEVEGLARQAVSQGDGSFALLGLDAPLGVASTWTCEAALDGWPDQYLEGVYDDEEADLVEAWPQDETSVGSWSLNPGIGVGGQIMGPDGPVVGAGVYVYASSQVVQAVTDEEGRYEAWAVPPGAVLTWASAPGYGVTYWPDADRPVDFLDVTSEGELAEGVDIHMPAESTLTGHLVAEGDLSGVTVLLYNDTHTVGRGSPVEADGSFLLDRLQDGDYELFVYADDEGYLNDWVRGGDGEALVYALRRATEHDAGDIVLPLGASVSGVVRDEDGAPIYGAYVYATRVGGDDVEVAAAGHDGAWTIPGLLAEAWQLYARYAPYCEADPGWVTVYWPGEVYELRGESVSLATGERLEGLDFTLPSDDDHDGMGDTWEAENGLDPGRNDAAEDPDGDGYTNLDEYLLGTDPQVAWTDEEPGCGCTSGARSAGWWVWMLLLPATARRRRYSRTNHTPYTDSPRSLNLRW
ncbi:MAG: carboxypeptidase-like regulatory domain-containing protein [Pseudomonadota bacterium]